MKTLNYLTSPDLYSVQFKTQDLKPLILEGSLKRDEKGHLYLN